MENVEWAVGRRKKFGEESGFVNVRVPKSRIKEYQEAIKRVVEEKFAEESLTGISNIESGRATIDGSKYRSFEEFADGVFKEEKKVKVNR